MHDCCGESSASSWQKRQRHKQNRGNAVREGMDLNRLQQQFFKFNRSMRSDIVTIQPQVVQFGRESVQTIKIINNTSAPISNFFFCLYNTEKFTFSPDSFSLAGHEHRLVTITLRLKSGRSVAKEFAYLKSSEINRRITLLINSYQSPEAKSRMDEGIEDVNTFSSREYNEIQTEAIERIIKEKQAYIELLERERESVNRHINFRSEESTEKVSSFKRENEQLEMKIILTENEKQSILKENQALQQKFEEYRKYCEVDLKNYEKIGAELREKSNQIAKLNEEVQYLESQGEQFIKKLEEKEARIRELENLNRRSLEEHKREAEKKLSLIEGRLEEQKRSYQQTSRQSQDRIRELQKKLESSDKFKMKTAELQRQLKRKQQENKNLMQAIQSERNTLRELQGEKKKLIKFQVLNQSMNEKNSELTSRLKEMEKINHNLKEELFVYKSKVAENDISSDKMSQYLEIALESCKSENDALKRTKKELEKSLDEFMAINRQSHDNNKSLSEQLNKYKEESQLLLQIKENLERRNEEIKQEHHLEIMKLKTENIQILERLSIGQSTKREERLIKLEEELIYKERLIEKCKAELDEQFKKNEYLIEDNIKLGQKVKRYKKEAKKELKSINETAISQLNHNHEEKKQMTQKIAELEQVIISLNCQRTKNENEQRGRSASGKHAHQAQGNLRKERTSSRIIGIKDQRREIHDSNKAYSQTSQQDHMFSQLGELRELNNYIRNEEERFNRVLQLEQEMDLDETANKTQMRPIFRAIKFFKKIENKFREMRGESQISSVKEVQFLKGRIRELQCLKQQKDSVSNVNLSKTRQQFSQLLDHVKQQMRNQYKKLNDHIRLCEQKYQLLKKKIYEEYRAKIIEVLSKKEKNSLPQLEATLERFVEGMSNLSHKEAVLHKEVKLKQNARKQNIELKEKVNSLNQLLQTKKGYCTRDPLKMTYNDGDNEWQESLKRQAEFLTLSAEYQRLKEEHDLQAEELTEAKQNYARIERQLDDRSNEILRLKRYQVELQTNYENEIQKQYDIIEENKKRIMDFTKSGKETAKSSHKEKQYNTLKENLQKQKDVIKTLRDKEKMLEEILQESHKCQEKERKKINEESRVIETLRDLKENNRELRNQNIKLKEKSAKLEEELEKKTTYLKNLKGDLQENRVRVQRKEEAESQKLKEEVKRLTDQVKKVRDQLDKTKKKKDKEISQSKNQIDRLNNQNLINVKSLQSIIRALMDNLRDIYGRLRYFIKKRKNREIPDHHELFDTSRSVGIDGLKISQAFGVALQILQSSQ